MKLTLANNTRIAIVALVIAEFLFGPCGRMRMAVFALDDSDQFLDEQKQQDAGQYPRSHAGLAAVVVAVFRRVRAVHAAELLAVAVLVAVAVVIVRGQRVGDEVQERVAQQPAGREAQQYLQERLVLVFVLDGYEEQHEKRQHADGHGGAQRLGPERGVDRHRAAVVVVVSAFVVLVVSVFVVVRVIVVVVVVVVVVPVAQAQFRQAQEHEREQERPAHVLGPLLGRRRHG